MRIAVNTRLLLKGKLEGIGWYTYQILERLVKNHPEHEFIFFFDRPYDPSFIFGKNVTPVVLQPQARHPLLFYIWFEFSIPRALKKYKADVFLSPDGLCSLKTKVPTCLVIHDLAFEHFPEHLIKSHRYYLRHYSPLFAQKAQRIITVSTFSKKDIAQQYQISENKIAITYNGANSAYQPLSWEERERVKAQYTAGVEYFVFAGALHPRKNILNLLKAFVEFKKWQKSPMKLVIVGRMAWNFKELVAYKESMLFKEDVIWVGYLDVMHLCKVIGAAYAMVYPSIFEGFGIPILEALKCHVPVIISNTTSMPEVGGNAALYVDPNDYHSIADQMKNIYRNEQLRKELILNAQTHATQFNWEQSAEILWQNLLLCLPEKD